MALANKDRLIDTAHLDYALVEQYRSETGLLKQLAGLTMGYTDASPHALAIAKKRIDGIEPLRLPERLWRGFRLHDTKAERFGLVVGGKGCWFPELRTEYFEKPRCCYLDRPLGFTGDPGIAFLHGEVIVYVASEGLESHLLRISDELAYAIARFQGRTQAVTQDLVILLPSAVCADIVLSQDSPISVHSIW